MLKAIVTDMLKPVAPEEAILRQNGVSLVYGDCKTEIELVELTQDADAIIDVYARLSAKVINSLKRCQVIVRRGIGYDSIDIKAATAKGIPVANVRDYCIDEVADHTITLLLCATRKVIKPREQVKSGGWDFKQFLPILSLGECTLGLVGFGKIPRAVARRAQCFDLKVETSDPFISDELAAEHGVKRVSLEKLLSTSDFVSVHVPLNDETRGMFTRREFAMMKPSAVFINTSRGPVVDEVALAEALHNGKIAFAALDVMTREPPTSDNPLRLMHNVIITPHLAWYSERSAKVVGEEAAQQIVQVFKGYFPKFLVNLEVSKLRTDLKWSD